MKIVVLEADTLNPGDLSWDALRAIGDCRIYPHISIDRTVTRAKDAALLLVNKTPLMAATIDKLKSLRYIGVMATGYNTIDIAAANAREIVVSNVPTYGTPSVAQMVFAHLLNLSQRVAHHHHTVIEGRWASSKNFCYWDYPLVELQGLTMGVVGMGHIGKTVAKIALAFGMRILFHTPHPDDIVHPGMQAVELDTLFRDSDVVTLHCPLTAETRGLVNAGRLALMKPGAFLINTSRGPLIDEDALLEALKRGVIAGAGLDVLSVEPPSRQHPLYQAPNCAITPHIAWATRASRQRLMDETVSNVRAFLEGNPLNRVG